MFSLRFHLFFYNCQTVGIVSSNRVGIIIRNDPLAQPFFALVFARTFPPSFCTALQRPVEEVDYPPARRLVWTGVEILAIEVGKEHLPITPVFGNKRPCFLWCQDK